MIELWEDILETENNEMQEKEPIVSFKDFFIDNWNLTGTYRTFAEINADNLDWNTKVKAEVQQWCITNWVFLVPTDTINTYISNFKNMHYAVRIKAHQENGKEKLVKDLNTKKNIDPIIIFKFVTKLMNFCRKPDYNEENLKGEIPGLLNILNLINSDNSIKNDEELNWLSTQGSPAVVREQLASFLYWQKILGQWENKNYTATADWIENEITYANRFNQSLKNLNSVTYDKDEKKTIYISDKNFIESVQTLSEKKKNTEKGNSTDLQLKGFKGFIKALYKNENKINTTNWYSLFDENDFNLIWNGELNENIKNYRFFCVRDLFKSVGKEENNLSDIFIGGLKWSTVSSHAKTGFNYFDINTFWDISPETFSLKQRSVPEIILEEACIDLTKHLCEKIGLDFMSSYGFLHKKPELQVNTKFTLPSLTVDDSNKGNITFKIKPHEYEKDSTFNPEMDICLNDDFLVAFTNKLKDNNTASEIHLTKNWIDMKYKHVYIQYDGAEWHDATPCNIYYLDSGTTITINSDGEETITGEKQWLLWENMTESIETNGIKFVEKVNNSTIRLGIYSVKVNNVSKLKIILNGALMTNNTGEAFWEYIPISIKHKYSALISGFRDQKRVDLLENTKSDTLYCIVAEKGCVSPIINKKATNIAHYEVVNKNYADVEKCDLYARFLDFANTYILEDYSLKDEVKQKYYDTAQMKKAMGLNINTKNSLIHITENMSPELMAEIYMSLVLAANYDDNSEILNIYQQKLFDHISGKNIWGTDINSEYSIISKDIKTAIADSTFRFYMYGNYSNWVTKISADDNKWYTFSDNDYCTKLITEYQTEFLPYFSKYAESNTALKNNKYAEIIAKWKWNSSNATSNQKLRFFSDDGTINEYVSVHNQEEAMLLTGQKTETNITNSANYTKKVKDNIDNIIQTMGNINTQFNELQTNMSNVDSEEIFAVTNSIEKITETLNTSREYGTINIEIDTEPKYAMYYNG